MAELDFIPPAAPGTAMNGITGFTSANYYEAQAGVMLGSTSMTHVVIGRLKTGRGGPYESIAGVANLFGGGGYQLSKDGTRFTGVITDGAGNPLATTGALFGDSSGGGILTDFSAGMYFYYAQTWDGSAGNAIVNGRNQFNLGTASPGLNQLAGGNYTWGMNAAGNNSPFLGAIVGSALHESAVFTEDQLFDHYLACRDALELVDGGLGWEHRWLASEAVAGVAAPATLTDVGAAGTLYNLSRVGALTVESHRPYWVQSVP